MWNYVRDTIKPDFDDFPGHIYIVDETELESYSIYNLEAKFREVDDIALKETGHRN